MIDPGNREANRQPQNSLNEKNEKLESRERLVCKMNVSALGRWKRRVCALDELTLNPGGAGSTLSRPASPPSYPKTWDWSVHVTSCQCFRQDRGAGTREEGHEEKEVTRSHVVFLILAILHA